MSYRVRGLGLVPPVEMPTFKRAGATLAGRAARDAPACASTATTSIVRSISARSSTSALTFAGPAILDQFDCTTVIYPGQTARVDEWKNILIVTGAAR